MGLHTNKNKSAAVIDQQGFYFIKKDRLSLTLGCPSQMRHPFGLLKAKKNTNQWLVFSLYLIKN